MDRRAAVCGAPIFYPPPDLEMHEDSCVIINHWKFALVILTSVIAATIARG